MALTPRQTRFYVDRAHIYRRTDTLSSAYATLESESWERIASDVPCYFSIGESFGQPGPYGREEGDNMFTVDHVVFADDVVIDEGYWLKNVSVNTISGTPTQNDGRYWQVMGQPTSLSQRGARRAQRREVLAVQRAKPPFDLSL